MDKDRRQDKWLPELFAEIESGLDGRNFDEAHRYVAAISAFVGGLKQANANTALPSLLPIFAAAYFGSVA